MTYYAKMTTDDAELYLAYFDRNGAPVYELDTRILVVKPKTQKIPDATTVHIYITWRNCHYKKYVDSLIVTKYEHRSDVERRIMNLCRQAKLNYIDAKYRPQDAMEEFNPRRDYRVRTSNSGTSSFDETEYKKDRVLK